MAERKKSAENNGFWHNHGDSLILASFIIACGVLFGGEPDLTDAISASIRNNTQENASLAQDFKKAVSDLQKSGEAEVVYKGKTYLVSPKP